MEKKCFFDALEIILKAMKASFEKGETDKHPYDPEFVAKIKRSEKNFEEGKYTSIKIEDLR
jgi:hypothetical protein